MSEPEPRDRARRWRRRALAIALGLAFVELSAFGLFWAQQGEPPWPATLGARRDALARGERLEGDPDAEREAARVRERHTKQTPHPYVGFVVDPDLETWLEQDAIAIHGAEDAERRPDRVIVGLFGGSVAFQLGNDHAEVLRRALAPLYPDREVVLVVGAMPSWKQPQMLLDLAWLHTLGYRFDVIIELDGLNDLTSATANYRYRDIHPAYPYDYRSFIASRAESPAYVRRVGEIAHLQRLRQERAGWLPGPLGWSPTANLLWASWDRGAQTRIDELREWLLNADSPEGARYAQRGPRTDFGDREAITAGLREEVVGFWFESNVQMAALARLHDARLAVMLQPNQYVPDSKPFSEEEQTEYRGAYTMSQVVPPGYELLRRRGAELRDHGVEFHDLTMVFEDVPQTTYADWCCHLNARGNALLAEAIADALREDGAPEPGTAEDAAPAE